jgi:hypothetical protein
VDACPSLLISVAGDAKESEARPHFRKEFHAKLAIAAASTDAWITGE